MGGGLMRRLPFLGSRLGSGRLRTSREQVAPGRAGDFGADRHLEGLARALDGAGWGTRAQYGQEPAVLQVFASDVPDLGESVRVKAGVGGVPWFVSSCGLPLAPCHDLAAAVAGVTESLGPLVATIRNRKGTDGQAR
jgi:hypothetical protein